MIIIGIDDTDIIGSPGTNQLARQIMRDLSGDYRCVRIVRHQLLDDPRVPYTSQNGSASIMIERRGDSDRSSNMNAAETASLLDCCRHAMQNWFVEGSDPGLCFLSGDCPPEIVDWGHRCQREFVARADAYALAADAGLHLESLGGTQDGVIGALAAIGLASTEDDGRIVQLGEWPDDLSGSQAVNALTERGVRVCEMETERVLTDGSVDVGKHLRPNVRNGGAVLFVESPHDAADQPTRHASEKLLRALKLP